MGERGCTTGKQCENSQTKTAGNLATLKRTGQGALFDASEEKVVELKMFRPGEVKPRLTIEVPVIQ